SSASIRFFSIEAIRLYEMSSEEFWQEPLVEISDSKNGEVLNKLDNSLVIDSSNDFKDPTIG
ncbi:25953_t:CDS:2, partial [Racocetra persica]